MAKKTETKTAAGRASGIGKAAAASSAIATAAGAAFPTGKATRKAASKKKRKAYWDDDVDRVLKGKFKDATYFKPKVVVETVLNALAPKIRQSGRKPPSRGLILRRSGHWKS
jgi:hypothetical protein